MEIYITKGVQQIGPFTEQEIYEQLESGITKSSDLAWTDGCSDWVQLAEIIKTLRVSKQEKITKWHYQLPSGNSDSTPESILKELVQKGTINSNTLVWRKGMKEWEPASKVLSNLFPKIKWHYLLPSGSNASIDDDKLCELVRRGIIQSKSLLWCKGMKAWQPAIDVLPTLFK